MSKSLAKNCRFSINSQILDQSRFSLIRLQYCKIGSKKISKILTRRRNCCCKFKRGFIGFQNVVYQCRRWRFWQRVSEFNFKFNHDQVNWLQIIIKERLIQVQSNTIYVLQICFYTTVIPSLAEIKKISSYTAVSQSFCTAQGSKKPKIKIFENFTQKSKVRDLGEITR